MFTLADPGFPVGGSAKTPGRGTPTYNFCQIFQKKLHEIEKIWTSHYESFVSWLIMLMYTVKWAYLHLYFTGVEAHIYCPQRSCGKVIFSEVYVKNFVRGGGCTSRGHAWQGVCVVGGRAGQEKMAIAAGGTHPTLMHSFFSVCSIRL